MRKARFDLLLTNHTSQTKLRNLAAELGRKVAVLDYVKPTPLGTYWDWEALA